MATSKAQQSLVFATKAAESAETWIDLHNALFSIWGRCAQLFPTRAEPTAFQKTIQHKEIRP